MVHPPGSPREGAIYRLIIYQAQLQPGLLRLQTSEVAAVFTLSRQQAANTPVQKPTLGQLLDDGAQILAGTADLNKPLHALGTATVLGKILT